MQNKGFVKVFAILLTIVCLFYLSFSFVTYHYEKKVARIAQTEGQEVADRYMDSLLNNKVYLNIWTLRDCRELGIGLGLDLKGGMNVILEVSVPDVVKALADHKENTDENFRKAVEQATKEAVTSQDDFISLFIKDYKALEPNKALAELFATQQLREKVTTKSTDKEVESVLREEVESAIKNSFNVLRTRIDRFGVAQPNIQQLKDNEGRIMVEMPGVKEPERVRKLLQGSANLEFWETYDTKDILPYLITLDAKLAAAQSILEENAPAETNAEPAEQAAEEKTETDENAGDLASAIAEKSTDESASLPATTDNSKQHPLLSRLALEQNAQGGCVVGYAYKLDMSIVDSLLATPEAKEVLPSDLSLKWGVKGGEGNRANIFELYAIKVKDRSGRAPLEGDVITTATDEFDQNGKPCVSMKMNVNGARRWAALTKENVGHSIAIVLDNNVYSAPTVQNEITGGNSQITGRFSPEDTRDLANVLKSGKMPAPAKIVSEEIIGPSLGAKSINQGIWSCIIAFVILMVYMIMMYGFIPGMVANSALILNIFFTIGVLTSFQAALTLSGIAGIVLSLGMAVDANVLIYERTKEEMKAGKKVREALSAGYDNAFSAIFDSNLTSVITAIILYNFGTGPIKGFATTLLIGICVSFFTAVFLTRVVYTQMMEKDKWLGLTFRTAIGDKISFQNPSYKFMSAYKKSFTIFGILAVISIAFMLTRGFSRSIDFTGGRNFVVQLNKEIQPEAIREPMKNAFPESNTSVIAYGTGGKTIRISTNYRYMDEGLEVDSIIEQTLYETLKTNELLAKELSLNDFRNRKENDGGYIVSSQMVGSSIAKNIARGAIWSVILAFIAIFVYIFIRFRNLSFSIGAITALIVDIILILGTYSICWGWMPFSLEIDQTFIGAVLTAIGYSINDKVVVFDRIREFLHLHPKRDKQELFNDSLNSTLNRTINTSVSTFIVLAVIFCLGGASIRSFAFAMILGVVFGTLSSIFVAAPTAYLTRGKSIDVEEPETKK